MAVQKPPNRASMFCKLLTCPNLLARNCHVASDQALRRHIQPGRTGRLAEAPPGRQKEERSKARTGPPDPPDPQTGGGIAGRRLALLGDQGPDRSPAEATGPARRDP